jgi:hypothetical protein
MKNLNFRLIGLLFGLFGLLNNATAEVEKSSNPALYTDCKVDVKTPKNSGGHYFAEDCSKLWVLPPKYGSIEISLVPDVQSYLCSAYEDLKLHSANKDWTQVAAIDVLLKDKYGGQGVMHFTVSTNELIDEYVDLNPKLDRNFFNEIPINKGVISGPTITSFTPDSALTNKTVHEYDFGSKAAMEFFYGENRVSDDAMIALFRGSTPGQFILSPYGACEVIDASTGLLKPEIDESTLANRFAPVVLSSYDVKVGRKYTIMYNKSVLYKRIEKHTSKRRFFSRKKIRELFIDKKVVEGLDIKIDSESSDLAFDDAFIKEVRESFIDKLINEVAVPKVGANTIDSVDGQTGAKVIAKELGKVCKAKYCKYAVFGLRTLSEIFGTGSSSAKTTLRFNKTITETYDERSPIVRVTNTSFLDQDDLEEKKENSEPTVNINLNLY